MDFVPDTERVRVRCREHQRSQTSYDVGYRPNDMRNLLLPLLLCTLACTDDAQTTEQGTEEGGPDPGVTFATDYDATSLCGTTIDRIEFATRRTNCWDPELPCTLDGSVHWTVTVAQTGQWETQLRVLAGDMQQGVFCFATDALGRTNVANVDLESNTEFALFEVADSQCSNP
jgi:hypothetical protein